MSKVERWLGGRLKDIRAFIEGLYEHDLHAKRVDALAGATLGAMTSASLAVAVIGQALAQARRSGDQARDRAGRLTAQQSEHRCLGQLRPLGAASDRRPEGNRCRYGLDRVRSRWAGNARPQPGDRAWPRHATAVGDGLERGTDRAAQRF